jgi:glutamate-1-semialdehyde 2,1-aminomutase
MKMKRSKNLFERAKRFIPGGVNSPVRAFRGVGGDPLFISRAKGSRIWDADGASYVDYVLSWGPMILGHAHPKVVSAVKTAAARGMSFGAPTESEVRLAELIQKAFPSMERLRMVSSGTEAAMSAIRVARGFTGRDKILKFDGGYHGHADSLLVRTGSGGATLGVPDSAGVPADFTRNTLILPYNDLSAVSNTFEQYGREIACVIVEPVAGNMGVVLPREGFLEGLRGITRRFESLLIFDEVITGFRIAFGGAQERFNVTPDLTCLGKIIGGGLPVGVYGGRADIMEKVAPTGPVYQAGTLSGNPVAMAAGLAALSLLSKKSVYNRLERLSADLSEGLGDAAKRAGVPVVRNRVGSMLSLFFTSRPVEDYTSARQSDTRAYSKYFWSMIEQGFYFAPSQFEAAFLSTAHLPSEIDKTIRAAHAAFKKL